MEIFFRFRINSFYRLLLISAFCSNVFATETIPIQWAGISVIGTYSDAQIVAPITSKLIENKEFKLMLNTRLINELKKYNKSSKNFKVVFDDYLSGKDIDSLALSFAIAGEDETLTEIDGVLSATVRLQVLALVINMSPDENARKIVTSIPLRVRHRFVLNNLNDFSSVKTKTFTAMLDGSGSDTVLDAVKIWGERLGKVKFRDKDLFLSIKPIILSNDVKKAAQFSDVEAKNLSYRASSMLQSIISEKSDIPILPNNLDSTLSTLVVSFASTDQNGYLDAMGFKIPEPDYTFQVTNTKLVSNKKQEKQNVMTLYGFLFGGAFSVDFREDDDLIFNLKLKSIQQFTFLAKEGEQWKFSDQQEYAKLIVNFCNELAMAFDNDENKIDDKWFVNSKSKDETKNNKEISKSTRKFPPKDEYI